MTDDISAKRAPDGGFKATHAHLAKGIRHFTLIDVVVKETGVERKIAARDFDADLHDKVEPKQTKRPSLSEAENAGGDGGSTPTPNPDVPLLEKGELLRMSLNGIKGLVEYQNLDSDAQNGTKQEIVDAIMENRAS